jgi:hypothetical protein
MKTRIVSVLSLSLYLSLSLSLSACLSTEVEELGADDAGGRVEAEPGHSDAQTLSSAPAYGGESESTEEMAAPAPQLTLAWSDLSADSGTELAGSQTWLTITNHSGSDANLVVDLDWVGDLGTTRSYGGELDSVIVESDAGSELDVAVDLDELFPNLDADYSGYLHVVARIAFSDGQYEQVISPGLYFHQAGANSVVYDEAVLRGAYRAGDFDGLVEESAQLVDEAADSEIVRIVAYEAEESAEELLVEDATDLAPTASGGRPASTGGSLAHTADPQSALFNQTLCVNWKVQTVDSGSTNSVGITEDYWSTANAGVTTFGYGVRVKIGASQYDTDFAGCVTFTTSNSSYVGNVQVYAYVTDVNGNFLRMHSGDSSSQDSYPGTTYSLLFLNTPFTSGTTTTLEPGSYSARWTALVALAHSLWWYNDNVSNTEFHVSDLAGQNPDVDDDCGANVNYYNDVANNESYIRLVSANTTYCPFHNQQNKFVLAHEYGHAYGFQLAGIGSQSPAATNHAVTPAGSCSFTGGYVYDNNTKEWSSIGIREGFAHFISAAIWNAPAADGQFKWGANFDLERWDAGNTEGGYLVNNCCPGTSMSCATSLDGAGVITDWMRAFWDMYTDSTCTSLDKENLPYLYALTILLSGLANDNFFPKTQDTMTWWSSTCQDRWDFIGCHNGIDRQGAIWSGC